MCNVDISIKAHALLHLNEVADAINLDPITEVEDGHYLLHQVRQWLLSEAETDAMIERARASRAVAQ